MSVCRIPGREGVQIPGVSEPPGKPYISGAGVFVLSRVLFHPVCCPPGDLAGPRSVSLVSCSLSFFILCARDLAGPHSVCSVSLCHPYLPPSLLLLLHDLANFPGHSLQTKPPTPSPLHPGESQRAGYGIPASSCGPQLWLSTDELLGSPFPTCPSWLPPHSSQKYLVVDLMVIIQFIFDLWNRRE